jgi:hypothetical protein
LAHSSIGTPSAVRRRPSTACRHAVSGTISFPSRGAFHLSLTVLVHYRSSRVFSLRPWSAWIPTGFLVSRGTHEQQREAPIVSHTGLSPSVVARSRDLLLRRCLVTPCGPGRIHSCVVQPRRCIGLPAVKSSTVWALPRSLAATDGMISFPPGTEMVQFPGFPPTDLCVQSVVPGHDSG